MNLPAHGSAAPTAPLVVEHGMTPGPDRVPHTVRARRTEHLTAQRPPLPDKQWGGRRTRGDYPMRNPINSRIVRREAHRMVPDLFLVSFSSWLVMIFVGAAHSNDGVVPALGFRSIWCLLIATRLIVSFIKQSDEIRS